MLLMTERMTDVVRSQGWLGGPLPTRAERSDNGSKPVTTRRDVHPGMDTSLLRQLKAKCWETIRFVILIIPIQRHSITMYSFRFFSGVKPGFHLLVWKYFVYQWCIIGIPLLGASLRDQREQGSEIKPYVKWSWVLISTKT